MATLYLSLLTLFFCCCYTIEIVAVSELMMYSLLFLWSIIEVVRIRTEDRAPGPGFEPGSQE
jgi:hypothetical protein